MTTPPPSFSAIWRTDFDQLLEDMRNWNVAVARAFREMQKTLRQIGRLPEPKKCPPRKTKKAIQKVRAGKPITAREAVRFRRYVGYEWSRTQHEPDGERPARYQSCA